MAARRMSRSFSSLIKVNERLIGDVAKELGDETMTDIFVEAQFAAMSPDFCKCHFKMLYPPSSVAFSGRCWYRFGEYMSRGVRDGS